MKTGSKKLSRSTVQKFGGLSPAKQAQLAFMRFGLGPLPGGAKPLTMTDGAAYEACLEEIRRPEALQIPDSQVVFIDKPDPKQPMAILKPDTVLDYANCGRSALWHPSKVMLAHPSSLLSTETTARYVKAMEPQVGFAERLVRFWSNHFSIYGSRNYFTFAWTGHFERAVIRKHALGKFSDMLKAVYQHPAMIYYLDNNSSIGPNSISGLSVFGKAQKFDYNENLAREMLELHTVGSYDIDADGNYIQNPDKSVKLAYTQLDVVNLAKVLTGWTCWSSGEKGGQFRYLSDYHEPGEHTVLKKKYTSTDQQQGLDVLDDLAKDRRTAQHIAFKLVQHFITDDPPIDAVLSLKEVFLDTGGDLQAVAKALLNLSIAWTTPMDRIVQPSQWQISIMRGLGFTKNVIEAPAVVLQLRRLVNNLSQGDFNRLTPDGHPDQNYFWVNPDFMRARKEWAYRTILEGSKNGLTLPVPETMIENLLPGVASAALTNAMAGLSKAGPVSRLTLLFSAPEYILR